VSAYQITLVSVMKDSSGNFVINERKGIAGSCPEDRNLPENQGKLFLNNLENNVFIFSVS
jgi:hypothetical protein